MAGLEVSASAADAQPRIQRAAVVLEGVTGAPIRGVWVAVCFPFTFTFTTVW